MHDIHPGKIALKVGMRRKFNANVIYRSQLLLLAGILIIFQTISGSADGSTSITADEIVEQADRIRFPAGGFEVDVSITTHRPDDEPEVKTYRVLSKGNDRSVLMTTSPPSERGNILLMRDLDLWAFLPNLSQPVRLPISQKLAGEVANGDLARANFSGDYNAELLRTDTLDGKEYYVLELKAARRGVTYSRVMYWVEKDSFRPYKAEFYSLSKRLLKTCRYEAYKEMGGKIRPTQLVMEDALKKENKSVLEYGKMRLRELPDKIFSKSYLKKLGNK